MGLTFTERRCLLWWLVFAKVKLRNLLVDLIEVSLLNFYVSLLVEHFSDLDIVDI